VNCRSGNRPSALRVCLEMRLWRILRHQPAPPPGLP
jgi:hypothetical protein